MDWKSTAATVRGSETILLVEPDPETRALAAFMLAKLGYNVWQARNGLEAVTLFAEGRAAVDLLFTETLMNKLNGHELAQILTRDHPGLRVLFLADAAYARLTRNIAGQKGLHFLQRPFTMRTLAGKVREVLDQPQAKARGAS